MTFKEGDSLKGVVKAVNDFGVFLDVGASVDALLPWIQVSGCGPKEGEELNLEVERVDEKGRLTLCVPGGRGRTVTGAFNHGRSRAAVAAAEKSDKLPVGGFIYDTALGVRPRRKGGKGDQRGAYSYPDGMSVEELELDDDVSGHVTNFEPEGCWIDIGATKDAFLQWENAPKSSAKWLVGDLIDNLKVSGINGQEIGVTWDDEGIGSLTQGDWEKLFAAGPRLPEPKEEEEERSCPLMGENCCAFYGLSAAKRGAADEAKATAELLSAPAPAQVSTGFKGYMGCPRDDSGSGSWSKGSSSGAMRGWGPERPGKGKGGGYGFAGDTGEAGSAASAGKSGGSRDWGFGAPAETAASGEYGRSVKLTSARARSTPPPSQRRLRPIEDVSIGEVVRGKVSSLSRVGVLVDFGCEVEGLIPRVYVTTRCRKGEVIPKLNVMGVDVASGKVTLEPVEDE